MSYFGTHIARRAVLACALLSSIVVAISPLAPAQAQTAPKRDTCGTIDHDLLDARSIFKYGVTPEDLQEQFYGHESDPNDGSYNDDGYRPVRLTGYVDDGKVRFATKWVKLAGANFTSRFGLTGDQFDARFNQLRATHRIVDISAYNTPDGPRPRAWRATRWMAAFTSPAYGLKSDAAASGISSSI